MTAKVLLTYPASLFFSYPLPFRRLARGTFAPSLDAGAAMEENYPFAITGINLTNLLFEILGWGMVCLS
jgi:hypothetical protein